MALLIYQSVLKKIRWRDVKLRAFDDAKHRTYVDLKVENFCHPFAYIATLLFLIIDYYSILTQTTLKYNVIITLEEVALVACFLVHDLLTSIKIHISCSIKASKLLVY